MKLESQVVSLKLSKRLKELGVKQESVFYWRQSKSVEGAVNYAARRPYVLEECEYPAFTVAELGEMLNIELTDANESESYTLQISSAIDFWSVWIGSEDIKCTPQIEDTNLAEALAKLLIHLIENNLITI